MSVSMNYTWGGGFLGFGLGVWIGGLGGLGGGVYLLWWGGLPIRCEDGRPGIRIR